MNRLCNSYYVKRYFGNITVNNMVKKRLVKMNELSRISEFIQDKLDKKLLRLGI